MTHSSKVMTILTKNLVLTLVKVDAEEEFEIIAEQTKNSLNDVYSPIICGSDVQTVGR